MNQNKNSSFTVPVSGLDYKLAPWIASALILSWFFHLVWMLRNLSEPLSIQMIFHVLVQTFLSTGLFITCHDSIHGLVSRHHPKLNEALGRIAIFLYAGFSYSKLQEAHLAHHDHPVTEKDPDYTRDPQERLGAWLWEFATRYYGWPEFLKMHLHVIFVWVVGGALWKVFLCFAIPAWLSAFQLFFFGTYLPHRVQRAPEHDNPHRARSNSMPRWLSLLTCYHFGYHFEHHQYPFVPWWRLPSVRFKEKLVSESL